MKHRFSQVVAIITLALVLAALGCTIAGAVMSGELGKSFLLTGVFGFVAVPILGWFMIRIYERVHRDEDVNEELLKKAKSESEAEK